MTILPYIFVGMVIATRVTNGDDKLVMVNLLYRHGARSPVAFYPTDPHKNHWPDGTGRLTQYGMRLEYDIGLFLKERYVNTKFVNQSYLHKEVYIRSSGVDRCLQSAEAQLAGLYPPHGWQVWSKNIPSWQPIPVQTVPKDEDPLLRPGNTKNCPEYGKLIKRMQENSDEFKNKIANSSELMKYLQEKSGMGENLTLSNMYIISDCAISERAEGLQPPKWVMDRFDDILDLSNFLFFFRYRGTGEDGDLLGRLTGGSLLGKMIGNMKNYTISDEKEKEKYYKLNIFSGHDSSILSLSAALNIPIKERLPFAAIVLVELFQNEKSEYYLKMTYRHNGTMTQWKLPDCDYNCPLDDFIAKTKKRVPTDRPKDCNAIPDPGFFTYHRLTIISAVLFSLTIFFFIVIVWICIRRRFKKKNQKYHLQYDDTEQSKSLIS